MSDDVSDSVSEAVNLTFDGGVAVLELSEPKSRNALSDAIKEGLEKAADTLARSKDLRALVITGSGGVFCAGGDLKAMLRKHLAGESENPDQKLASMKTLHIWFRKLRDLPVPTIVAVDGPAFGAGFGLALLGDVIICSDKASFGASFAKVGAVPDCNLMWSLPRAIGLQRAKELFYSARTVDAQEAKSLGIVMDIYPQDHLLPRALEMAKMMAEMSPVAFPLTKKIMDQSFDLSSDDMLNKEAQAQAICLTSAYHHDAIAAFASKQKPRFDFQ